MAYLYWIVLLTLLVFSFSFGNKIPLWIPIVGYLIVVFVRAKEKIGNYKDWTAISNRDEKIALEKIAEDMASKGFVSSGIRIREENKAKEDYQYERKKKKREFENELVNLLFLK